MVSTFDEEMTYLEELLFESRLFVAGQRLQRPFSSKDELLQALETVETYLVLVKLRAPQTTLAALVPSRNSLVNPELMRHPDKDVKLLVTNCLCEIIRITTPQEPYDDDDLMKEVLELIVASFQELGDINSPSFPRRLAILKTVSNIKATAIMADLEMDDLLLDMFKHFFSAVSQNSYSEPVYRYMESIMCCVLNENDDIPIKVELLSVLRINLRTEMKDLSPAAHSLSWKVVRSCAENLRSKLVSPLDQPISCKCQHGYHEIVYDICRHGSQEINANQYSTPYPEVISLPRSCSPEPPASSEDSSNSQFPSFHFDGCYHQNEMIRDQKNNDIERKREAPMSISTPMSISHSAEMGSNGVSLPEFRACKYNNNLVLLKSLIRKKPQKNSRMKRVPNDNNLLSKSLNRNRP